MYITFNFFKPNLRIRSRKLAEASVIFTEGLLKGTRLLGFTIHENDDGMFVKFPSYVHKGKAEKTIFHFLRPVEKDALAHLETLILDEYENQLDKVGNAVEKVSKK